MRVGQPWRNGWFGPIRSDSLAGVVVALALIPEAIAFPIIAGVGLYDPFWMAVGTAFDGVRPAMISAATGAIALLMVNLDEGSSAGLLVCGGNPWWRDPG